MTMTKEEIKKAIAEKQDLVRKLEVYQMTKGHTLPTGKDVNQSIIALQKQIKQHEYDLNCCDVLSDDEIVALARGEQYLNEKERKDLEEDKKFIRGLFNKNEQEDLDEIRSMIKAGR